MAEYIKRMSAMTICEKYSQHCFEQNDSHGQHIADGIFDDVVNIPTADVVEVRHGEWKYDSNGMDWNLGAWVCSLCGVKNDNLGMGNKINPRCFAGGQYRPHCGAKMDGKDGAK